jgi:hypothetical protein
LAKYPVQGIDLIEPEGGRPELVATLLGTGADAGELNQIVSRLNSIPIVESSSWNLRTAE